MRKTLKLLFAGTAFALLASQQADAAAIPLNALQLCQGRGGQMVNGACVMPGQQAPNQGAQGQQGGRGNGQGQNNGQNNGGQNQGGRGPGNNQGGNNNAGNNNNQNQGGRGAGNNQGGNNNAGNNNNQNQGGRGQFGNNQGGGNPGNNNNNQNQGGRGQVGNNNGVNPNDFDSSGRFIGRRDANGNNIPGSGNGGGGNNNPGNNNNNQGGRGFGNNNNGNNNFGNNRGNGFNNGNNNGRNDNDFRRFGDRRDPGRFDFERRTFSRDFDRPGFTTRFYGRYGNDPFNFERDRELYRARQNWREGYAHDYVYADDSFYSDCRNDRVIGDTLGGMILGGFLGNLASGGRTDATVAGMVFGGAAGNALGQDLGCEDRYYLYRDYFDGFQRLRPHTNYPWRNPRTGQYGTLFVGDYYRDRDGYQCATYSQEIFVRGRRIFTDGDACRQDDGTWVMIR